MMVKAENEKARSRLSNTDNNAVIRRLRQEITGGRHWYPALLEAIGRWDITEEECEGRTFRYLIAGEAFDWLLLAERLCQAIDDLIPRAEQTALLFYGEQPVDLPAGSFEKLISNVKYNQHLNFFYGITVEEALIAAVEEEVRKERWTSGYYRDRDNTPEAHRRIYGSTRVVLLRRFRREGGYSQLKSISLGQLKEFTYWLFKLRLKQCDKARVASDTRKALDWLESKGYSRYPGIAGAELKNIPVLSAEPAV